MAINSMAINSMAINHLEQAVNLEQAVPSQTKHRFVAHVEIVPASWNRPDPETS